MTVRSPLAWLLAGIIGVLVYAGLEHGADPGGETGIGVGRSEAADRARAFLEGRGFDISTFRHALVFQQDTTARSFFEKEFSREDVEALYAGGLPLFRWYARWFRPGELTDYRVWLGPDGALSGFARGLPDDAPGARLDEAAAEDAARAFLGELGMDLAGWSLHQRSAEEHPNRTDHNLTWQRDDFAGAPAFHRMWVQVQGDEIGAFYDYIDTPEAWDRAQSGDDAWRNLLQRLSAMPYNGLMLAVIALLLAAMRRADARYGFGLALALIVAGVDMAAGLNNLPNRWIGYATNQPVAGFWLSALWGIVFSGLLTMFNVAVLGIVAEPLGRGLGGLNARLAVMYRPSAWASREVAQAVLIGYGLMGVHLAYNVTFYVVGRDYFGVWSPEPSIYSNLLSTPFPFLYPLTIGLSAAVNEELAFRLIAIALLYRWTRSWPVAVVVPAVVWAFQHSLYPQDPFYIRGVELTGVGVVYGVVFLRHGLVAVLVAHFGYNAVVSGEILVTSGSAYLNASGAAVLVSLTIPLWPSAWRFLRHQPLRSLEEFGPEPSGAPSTARKAAPARALPLLPPASPRAALRMAAAIVAGLVVVYGGYGLVTILAKRYDGDIVNSPLSRMVADDLRPVVETALSRGEVIAIADAYLVDRGVDPELWRRTVSFDRSHGSAAMDYLFQRTNWDLYWDIVNAKFRHNAQWRVRYFRPGDPEGYYVYVLPDGRAHMHWHALAEDAAGAALPQEEARRIAEAFIAAETDFDLGEYSLADSDSTVRENRTDHWFAYEWSGLAAETASVRLSVRVLGDEALYPVHYVEVPNTWTRERAARDMFDYAAAIAGGALAIAGGIAVGALFVRCYLADLLPWRAALPWALVLLLTAVVRTVDAAPLWWTNYDTSTEPAVFITNAIAQYAMGLAGLFLGAWVGVAFAAGVVRLHLGPGVSIRASLRACGPAHWADGFLRAMTAFAILGALAMISLCGTIALAALRGPREASLFTQAPTPVIKGVELGLLPGLSEAAGGVAAAVGGFAGVALLWAASARYLTTPFRLMALYALFSLSGTLAALSRPLLGIAEHLFLVAAGAAFPLALFALSRRLFRGRMAGAVCLAAVMAILSGMSAAGLREWNSLAVGLFFVGALAAAGYLFRARPRCLETAPDDLSS